jgi:hypothetical protein
MAVGSWGYNLHAVVTGVQFGPFRQAASRSVLRILPDGQADALPAVVPLEVIRTFRVVLRLAINDNNVRLYPTVAGENDRAVARTSVGPHTLGEIDFLVRHPAILPLIGISVGITRS